MRKTMTMKMVCNVPLTIAITIFAMAELLCYVSGAISQSSTQTKDISSLNSESYYIIIDAGSSGSRIRVYSYNANVDIHNLPDFKEKFSNRTEPGVSECHTDQEIANHVLGLVKQAVQHVPKEAHDSSPIYFMATAGMRLMLEDKANDATLVINRLLGDKTQNPFQYLSLDNTRILSGEEEGIFAWIAANYLSKAFTNYGVKSFNTTGILELGGASTQIAFEPFRNVLAHKYPVRISGVSYNLYVHSYLIYGQEQVDRWIKETICKENLSPAKYLNIVNPCMLRGDSVTGIVDGNNVTFVGSGDPGRCSDYLHQLIYHPDKPWRCNPKPCAIGSVYQPSIRPEQHFYVAGAFLYPLKGFGVLKADGSFSLQETTRAAFNFCSMHIDTIRAIRNTSKTETTARRRRDYLSRECLTGLYMPILFTKAYRLKNDTRQLSAPVGLGDIEWPLGAVIYEYERQRCKPDCVETGSKTCPSPVKASAVVYTTSPPAVVGCSICGLLITSISWFTSIK